ncbi:tuftelin 1b isoform X1 [Cyprinodon tularosa]|uniref:tuftelin 1b isoform X1 n=2 Tax=Cyprinodon tularosa TaxID=77115 RepID=UPI0018E205CE|nr:tuftelin 1b isoform X1 [Cyprinodon tularosa]
MGSLLMKIKQVSECKMLWFSNTKAKSLPDGGTINTDEMSGFRGRKTLENGKERKISNKLPTPVRLSSQDQEPTGYTSERQSSKESSIAVVLPQKPSEQKHRAELITPRVEKEEVIKVYLEPRQKTIQSVRMLTDEVSHIQEVRYCLKSLREQMAARQNSNFNKVPANGIRVNTHSSQPPVTNNNNNVSLDVQFEDNQEDSAKLREVTRRLYAQLKEMEKQHQEERDRLEAESNECRIRLAEQSVRLQAVELQSEEKAQQVEELQRLLEGMRMESNLLKDKMEAGEAELLQLKKNREGGAEKEQRCTELNHEVAVLKEKIHHLDDMLKSQQRKLRHMIEQLQHARTIIQERDRVITDLEEKVAFLEAENKEMHDHLEHLLTGEDPPEISTENKPEIVYSKPLIPTSPTNKVLPLIKVIEIKS